MDIGATMLHVCPLFQEGLAVGQGISLWGRLLFLAVGLRSAFWDTKRRALVILNWEDLLLGMGFTTRET